MKMKSRQLHYLRALETEAIHVLREAVGEFKRPVCLFSAGASSLCLLRLLEKAFRPSEIPIPFLNVESGEEHPELLELRDRRAQEVGIRLIVRSVKQGIADGKISPSPGVSNYRLQIPVLLNAIEEFRFDCCIGGARRPEERARAKERFFSFRDCHGQWNKEGQRPEVWNLFNARINPGENVRVFPLSNWTKSDVWGYIVQEQLIVAGV